MLQTEALKSLHYLFAYANRDLFLLPMKHIIRLMIFLLCSPALTALDLEQYNKPDAPLWRDKVRSKVEAGYLRLIVDEFKELEKQRGYEHYEELHESLEVAYRVMAKKFLKPGQAKKAFAKLNQLAKTHPDPLLLWASATIGQRFVNIRIRHNYDRVVDGMLGVYFDEGEEKPRYNPLITLPLTQQLLNYFYPYRKQQDVSSARYFIKLFAHAFKVGLARGDDLPDELVLESMMEIELHNFSDEVKDGDTAALALASFTEVFDQAPIEPWLRDALKGVLHHKVALAYRGGGWASTVSQTGWDKFRAHNLESLKFLERAWQANPNPMIGGCGFYISHDVTGQASLEEWLDRALSTAFDNYFVLRAWSNRLKPRWGGSHQRLLERAMMFHELDRYDSNYGEFVFLLCRSVVLDVKFDKGGKNYLRKIMLQPKILRMIDEWYENSIDHNRYGVKFASMLATRRAVLLYRSGLIEEALALLGEIDKPSHDAFREMGLGGSMKNIMKKVAELNAAEQEARP